MSFPYHGLLLIDKPKDITSHDVVDQVRRALKTREVGHSGTLDPLATGLMVVLVGKATKLSPYIMDGNKSYRVEVQLGVRTDTLDITGQIIESKEVTNLHWQSLPEKISKLVGEFQWPVPMYSAMKVDGKKLYESARKNEAVEIPVKSMRFWQIENFESSGAATFWVDLSCSKGSFIRTWVDQLGISLGCGANMKSLIRTESSPYSLNQAVKLDHLKGMSFEEISKNMIEMSQALPQYKKVRVQAFDQTLLLNGQLSHDLRRLLIGAVDASQDEVIQVISSKTNDLLALVGFTKGEGFKIRRVLG